MMGREDKDEEVGQGKEGRGGKGGAGQRRQSTDEGGKKERIKKLSRRCNT